MELSHLEIDLLGDLVQDDHGVYEVFHFVRSHYPAADDAQVFRHGRELLVVWLERGWLEISPDEGMTPAGGLSGLLAIVDEHGMDATHGFDDAPWLRLTSRGAAAYRDHCANS